MKSSHTARFLIFLVCATILAACVQPGTDTPAPAASPAAPTATELPTTPATAAPTAAPSRAPGVINLTPRELPWWNDAVFYEIFVRSFADDNGDGIGDFAGLTAKLDYLNDGDPATTTDLGITGIWLMPIHPSPSYHGYDVTDYTAINPDYGTLDDFRGFLDAAHQRGIRVIIDLVLNHTSEEHPWFLSALNGPGAPYHDYYLWSDTDPGIRSSEGKAVWHRAANGQYYYGFFWSGMPDLNYTNPAVTQEMERVVDFWLSDVGVDGFRLDAARHLIEEGSQLANTQATHQWFEGFRQQYKAEKSDALTVGEIWDKSSVVATYTEGDELDLAFNFDLAGAWLTAAAAKDARTANFVLERDLKAFPPGQFATFLANHDQNRVINQVNDDVERAKSAAALLLTAPGVPFLYYGEEIGMRGQKPDEMIRTPMQWSAEAGAGFTTGQPWEAINPDFDLVNVAAQTGDPDSLLSRYRSLIQLRNASPALRSADAWVVDSGSKAVYALLRASPEQVLLVIANLSDDPLQDYALTLESGPLGGSFDVADLLNGTGGEVPVLAANAGGGFDAYRPLPELAPGAVYAFELRP